MYIVVQYFKVHLSLAHIKGLSRLTPGLFPSASSRLRGIILFVQIRGVMNHRFQLSNLWRLRCWNWSTGCAWTRARPVMHVQVAQRTRAWILTPKSTGRCGRRWWSHLGVAGRVKLGPFLFLAVSRSSHKRIKTKLLQRIIPRVRIAERITCRPGCWRSLGSRLPRLRRWEMLHWVR